MNRLYIVKAEGIYDRLDEILYSELGERQEIQQTPNGKPYIGGNALYFSLSHSGKHGAIALCDRPVGVDIEVFKEKRHLPIINSFCDGERAEICDERDFLTHWTVREAFIKMRGETLAKTLKSLAYVGGNLYFNDEKQHCELHIYNLKYGIVTVCTEKKV